MAKVCGVCNHPQRAEIDRCLVEGTSLRIIAERHGTTATTLHRHKKHVPIALTIAKSAEDVADADTLLSRVAILIFRLEGIATKAENNKEWAAASGALREVGRCLRLLGELSGELTAGAVVNVTFHLQRSVNVLLGASPEEFRQFWGTILQKATEAQLKAMLTSEETKHALSTIPFYDSLLDDDAVDRAARESLSDEECAALERINAKLQRFRDDHQAVKAGRNRIVVSHVEMAL